MISLDEKIVTWTSALVEVTGFFLSSLHVGNLIYAGKVKQSNSTARLDRRLECRVCIVGSPRVFVATFS